MGDKPNLQTVSDDEKNDEIDASVVDKTILKKRKATGAAAHMCLERIEGKCIRLTNEQKAEFSVYADHNLHLSREDIISWAVKQYDLEGSPAPALISSLRKPETIKQAKEYLSQETVSHKMQAMSIKSILKALSSEDLRCLTHWCCSCPRRPPANCSHVMLHP